MWVLFHLGPIKNEKGEVMLFLVTLKDISEYKDPIVGTGNYTYALRFSPYTPNRTAVSYRERCACVIIASIRNLVPRANSGFSGHTRFLEHAHSPFV